MEYALRASAAAALLAVAGSSFAGLSVSSAIPAGPLNFSDNSAEQWIDTNGNGVLDATDRLRGIFTIDTIESGGPATQIGGQSNYNELTGIFDTVVLSRVFASTENGINLYDYTFGASGQLAIDFAARGINANTVGIFFEDAANNYAREGCGTYAGCEATATGGDVWAEFGVGIWKANNAAENPALGAILAKSTPLGTFGVGLNFIVNNTGFDWNNVACADATNPLVEVQVDFCGQGGILATGRSRPDGSGFDTPYELFDNIDFVVNRAVPEPGSIALVGLALAGLGVATRRRKA